jgi:hypothetical protein
VTAFVSVSLTIESFWYLAQWLAGKALKRKGQALSMDADERNNVIVTTKRHRNDRTPPGGGGSVGGKQCTSARRFFTITVLVKLCIVCFYFGYQNTTPIHNESRSSSVNNDATNTIRRSSSSSSGGSQFDSSIVDCASSASTAAATAGQQHQQQRVTELSPSLQRRISKRVQEELAALNNKNNDQQSYEKNQRISYHHGSTHDVPNTNENENKQTTTTKKKLFTESVRGYAVGAVRVSTKEMLQTYDFGVPIKKPQSRRRLDGNNDDDDDDDRLDSIILYNTDRSLPTSNTDIEQSAIYGNTNGGGGMLAKVSVANAMENCDALNIIFTSLNNDTDCHILIGDFESYHINRWARMPKFDYSHRTTREKIRQDRKINHNLPLRHIGRITQNKNGVDIFELPNVWETVGRGTLMRREKGMLLEHFDTLKLFLHNVQQVLKELKELLATRDVVRDNTVVVLTVNSGQSELLTNFICSARSRGIDTGNVLVFPTDEISHRLAQGLGLASYYDEANFGKMPIGAAKAYGDRIFANMMFAKVLCVLYVSLLGHDVLFQDVDIVWFKDPLLYFHDKTNTALQEFDIMFQHDGNSQSRYSPYSANSGFYYVRANKKTSYLFTSLLYHGAIVRKSKSHQQVLVQLLNEHSSLFGLKVKVFDATLTDMFPGGIHYHQDWDTMKKIISGTSNAYLLHMSWTENKVNKVLFFRQLGEWYVQDKCIGDSESSALIDGDTELDDGNLIEQCCSVEPIFSCHYKDKPSKIPCPDSPRIDPHKHRSFW